MPAVNWQFLYLHCNKMQYLQAKTISHLSLTLASLLTSLKCTSLSNNIITNYACSHVHLLKLIRVTLTQLITLNIKQRLVPSKYKHISSPSFLLAVKFNYIAGKFLASAAWFMVKSLNKKFLMICQQQQW